MTSIYMPDEIISMFPADLSQQLLSLGAKECSFAFSCGVILDPMGKNSHYIRGKSIENQILIILYDTLWYDFIGCI